MIKEFDWKKLKSVKEAARERFGAATLTDCSQIMEQEGGSSHSKYLTRYEVIKDSDAKLESLFDHHSSSEVTIQRIMLRREGLGHESELGLCDELHEARDVPSANA